MMVRLPLIFTGCLPNLHNQIPLGIAEDFLRESKGMNVQE